MPNWKLKYNVSIIIFTHIEMPSLLEMQTLFLQDKLSMFTQYVKDELSPWREHIDYYPVC